MKILFDFVIVYFYRKLFLITPVNDNVSVFDYTSRNTRYRCIRRKKVIHVCKRTTDITNIRDRSLLDL